MPENDFVDNMNCMAYNKNVKYEKKSPKQNRNRISPTK